MKILLSWLDEFIDRDGRTPAQVAETLENLGHEVESIKEFGLPDSVVVGRVTKVIPHPNADRLRVAEVDTGEAIRTIICGAPNLEEGQTVVVALAGTTLPNGLVIEKRLIRGIDSDGMICAADELGLSNDHSGILVLPEGKYRVGEPFNRQVDSNLIQEALLDLSITANRGDCLSHLGIARELGAKWGQALKYQPMSFSSLEAERVMLRVDNPDLCPIYTARKITKVSSAPLPDLIRSRLDRLGHGVYHPVVDLTNYVMEELGVPLHAFDANKVSGAIVVRLARNGEKIRLLDGKTYSLTSDMLVIADEAKPLAVAGIMGGRDSAVTDQTTDIILEAAYFNPSSIRRTARALGIATSASYRFERGTDPAATKLASDRAAALIAEYLGGKVGPRVDVGRLDEAVSIPFVPDEINDRLGSKIEAPEMKAILGRLGFDCTLQSCRVPTWRHDVAFSEDLAEEVARVVGYDSLPRTALPPTKPVTNPDDSRWSAIEALKDQLARLGFTEHIGSSFLAQRDLQILGLNEAELIKLVNPVSEEVAYLRPTQILSLLKVIAKNPIFPDLRIFEIGTVWTQEEKTFLTLAWVGSRLDPVISDGLSRLLGGEIQSHPIDQKLLTTLKIRRPVMTVEISVDKLLDRFSGIEPVFIPPQQVTYRQPSRYQPVLRDIAILVDEKIQPDEVAAAWRKIEHIVDVELFDQFKGGKVPHGKQSLAFHLLLEDPERPLDTEAINVIMQQVIAVATTQFNAEVR